MPRRNRKRTTKQSPKVQTYVMPRAHGTIIASFDGARCINCDVATNHFTFKNGCNAQ